MSPTEVLRVEMVRYRREGCRLAAMILLAEPHRIGDEPIADFLRRIPCIRDETVRGWLNTARINPMRPGRELTRAQRDALANLLVAFWKAGKN